jgi:OOP family OmpA-OmpF porin
MKKSKPVLAILVVTAVTAYALPAAAQDSAFYIGGSVGQSKTKDFCQGTAMVCGDRKVGWAGFAGYQFNRNFAFEGGYHYLGKFTADNVGYWTGAFEASGLLRWPVTSDFSFYGRFGVYNAYTKSAPEWRRNNGWTYGIGGEYESTKNIAVRGELQRFNGVAGQNLPKADIDVASIALVLKFR